MGPRWGELGGWRLSCTPELRHWKERRRNAKVEGENSTKLSSGYYTQAVAHATQKP